MKYLLLLFCVLLVFISCSNKSNVKEKDSNLQIEHLANNKVDYDTTLFDFEPDIRLFTTMAFANISGYDFENTDSMSIDRIGLRNSLDSILTIEYKDKISEASKNDFFASIGKKAFSLSDPPHFIWLPDSLNLNHPAKKDSTYLELINEFYKVAKISDLWKKYESKLREANYQYIPFSSLAIDDILEYCRCSKDIFNVKKIVFNICPFMQNESGFTEYSNSQIYIVVSPRIEEPGPQAFYHEALHNVINPIVDGFTQKQIKKLLDASRVGFSERMKKMHGNYVGGYPFISECMVRTIDYILREKHFNYSKEKTLNEINNQYSYGLTLIPFFYEQLKEYETGSISLEEYFTTIIENYSFELEKERWQNFQMNGKY
ncbi:hypothetical protein [Sunxiuqinia rutila]|uniref:hypothetical protein n=1 Tax=Sunxiuqinia rutila TaxID=1397841 RepID=UPI003D3690D2